MKVWEIHFRCLDSLEPEKVWVEKIPYGYAETREEAMKIFWNRIARYAREYDIEIVDVRVASEY
jgi:hypothetical protein